MDFFETIKLSRPEALADLDSAIEAIVQEVREKNSPGGITLSVKIIPHGDGSVAVKDEIRVAVPKLKGEAKVLYFVNGKPTTKKPGDPRQPESPFPDPELSE